MQKIALYTLILAIVLGGSYWWYTKEIMPCRVPFTYAIGTIDARFNIDEAEAATALRDAEALWETAIGEDLFVYDPASDFVVNFVYDERQRTADQEKYLSAILEERKELSDGVLKEYETKLAEYETKKAAYDRKAATYETRLAAYERDVKRWNDQGGAPPDVYEDLEAEQDALAASQKSLGRDAQTLNRLVNELNALGEEGNGLAETYNDVAETYNERFGDRYSEEFTQGDYQGDSINIYEYRTEEELRLVLAHEFGHALGLDHILNEESIMYYLMGAQSLETGITAEDKAAFSAVCDAPAISHLLSFWYN